MGRNSGGAGRNSRKQVDIGKMRPRKGESRSAFAKRVDRAIGQNFQNWEKPATAPSIGEVYYGRSR